MSERKINQVPVYSSDADVQYSDSSLVYFQNDVILLKENNNRYSFNGIKEVDDFINSINSYSFSSDKYIIQPENNTQNEANLDI